MGFGDRLKSWFVVDDGGTPSNKKTAKKTTPTKTNKKAASKETTQSSSSQSTAPSTDSTSTVGAGQVTDKFMSILLGAMDKNNLEGFDYLEFKESLNSLAKMPMDEQTRYQSAFAMAQTMDATSEKLIKTAAHYINILEKEEKKFGQALAAQRTKQIGGRESHIKKMEEGIQQKAAQIKRLTEEIEADQKKLKVVKEEISGAVIKVETTKNNFVASFNSLVRQIQNDIDNIQKYLK